ncbi:hypothetical protein RMATCC62417_01644 [Rhizopus microsporus]|nr:hypothetical protein RMATCC62417_01644 [Rhizopus microsporus]
MGVSSRASFFGEFEEIENEYEGFISSAEAAKQAFCIIFCSPDMKKFELPFSSQPIVTDITYKAVKDNYYLYSSVIYVSHLKKHLVIFQAIIGGLEWTFFKKYFGAFFQYFGISRKSFLVVVMDFSAAQRKGILEAYRCTFSNSSGNEDIEDGIAYVKGCYMHWMQSVKRIASNYAVVPQGYQAEFTKLVYVLRTTAIREEFYRTVLSLCIKFPNCKSWLRWWLQSSISSIISRFGNLQHHGLFNHKTRTSNAVESYHSALYIVIVKEQLLASSLKYLLQYAKKDGQRLSAFFTDGIQPRYGQNKRKRKQRKIVGFYKMSDSRAPDNNKAIFGKQKTTAAADHADKTTTASKKRELLEVADTDNEKDDFELETHNFLNS